MKSKLLILTLISSLSPSLFSFEVSLTIVPFFKGNDFLVTIDSKKTVEDLKRIIYDEKKIPERFGINDSNFLEKITLILREHKFTNNMKISEVKKIMDFYVADQITLIPQKISH